MIFQFFLEAWNINNNLTMDLMKRIIEYTGREGPVVTNTMILRSKTILDEDEYEMIDNRIGDYDNSFQLGSFGGSSSWMQVYQKQGLTWRM